MAQSVHAMAQFYSEWPTIASSWMADSNYLVIVSVPDEQALIDLSARAIEEGIARTIVREPDLDNDITAVVLEPGLIAQRLCAQLPLAGRQEKTTGMIWWLASELAADDDSDPQTWFDLAEKFWELGLRYAPKRMKVPI